MFLRKMSCRDRIRFGKDGTSSLTGTVRGIQLLRRLSRPLPDEEAPLLSVARKIEPSEIYRVQIIFGPHEEDQIVIHRNLALEFHVIRKIKMKQRGLHQPAALFRGPFGIAVVENEKNQQDGGAEGAEKSRSSILPRRRLLRCAETGIILRQR